VLISSRYLTSWRDLRAVKVIVGAAIPLALLTIYFYWVGALSELWAWTMAFNTNVYAPRQVKGLGSALAFIWKITRQVFGADLVAGVLSAIGLILFAVGRLRAKLDDAGVASTDGFGDAILIPPLVYFAFCTVNFQGGPDLMPLFPFIGIFAGWLII